MKFHIKYKTEEAWSTSDDTTGALTAVWWASPFCLLLIGSYFALKSLLCSFTLKGLQKLPSVWEACCAQTWQPPFLLVFPPSLSSTASSPSHHFRSVCPEPCPALLCSWITLLQHRQILGPFQWTFCSNGHGGSLTKVTHYLRLSGQAASDFMTAAIIQARASS